MQQSFAHTMKSFKFEIIGETQTQDEIMIGASLQIVIFEQYPLANNLYL